MSAAGAHRIRLDAAWQRIESDPDSGQASRVQLPHEFVVANSVLRLRRVFHRPSRLDSTQSIWLCSQSLPESARVFLNDHLLNRQSAESPASVFQADITNLIVETNRLVIEVAGGIDAESSVVLESQLVRVGRVWLEIR